jgi:hypothetical protein
MSTLTIKGSMLPVGSADRAAVRPSPLPVEKKTAAAPSSVEKKTAPEVQFASAPRPDLEIEKTRFEVPPEQILVVDVGAAPGEARVTLEPKVPDQGSFLNAKY